MNLIYKASIFLSILFLTISIAHSQDSLKVISYNIEGMKPGTLPGFRLAHIIDELKTLDADIIALQEINQAVDGNGDDNQGMAIRNALSEHFGIEYHYYQQFTHLSWDNEFREYIAIVSKYSVLEEGFGQLATGVFPRKVVWNYIDTPLGMINFFSTHLSFNSGTVRQQQAQQIDAYLSNIEMNKPSVNSFLCGDFNDIPATPTITYLTESGANMPYYDSYPTANPTSPGYTVPSNGANRRIDYIFYTNNENGGGLVSSEMVMEGTFAGNFYRSDHLGVMSIFTAQPNALSPSLSNAVKVTLSPNPSNDRLNISSDEEIFQVSFYDAKGQLVKKDSTLASKSMLLDVSSLKAGIYLMQLSTAKGLVKRKFMKL